MRTLDTPTDVRSGAMAAVIVVAMGLAALALTHVAMGGNYLPLVPLYFLMFMALAWKYRTAAMFLVYASALFPFDIGGEGVAIGIGEIHLAFITVLLLFDFVNNRWPVPRSPLYVPVLIYFAVCVVSSTYIYHGTTTIVSIIQMFLYFIVTTAVFSNFVPDTKQHLAILPGILLAGAYLSLGVLITNNNYFMGLHKNGIGGALSYAVIVCAELWFGTQDYRKRGFFGIVLFILIAGLFRTLSRGAWLCGITGVLFIILLRGELRLIAKSMLVVLPLVVVSWFFLPEQDQRYIFGFSRQNQNIEDRLKSIDYAEGQFQNHPWIGNGVGLRKTYDATNIVYLTLAETGIFGLAGLALIHITFFGMIINARRRIAMNDPRFSILAIGGGLVFGKFVHGCVDHYWSRGSLLVVWGAAGMAIAAYYSILNEEQSRLEEAK